MCRTSLILSIILLSFSMGHASELRLPALVGDHMLLQQQSPVTIWGWAKPGTKVTLQASWLSNRNIVNVNGEGKWESIFYTPKAGGPYEIEIKSDTVIVLKDILIGEVWVCSGQSNMFMPLKGYLSQPVLGGNDYIAQKNNKNLRVFSVRKAYSLTLLDNCEGNWTDSNPKDIADFSAVAYFFGKYLQEILNIPIGLIHSSCGSSYIESWTARNVLEDNFEKLDFSYVDTVDQLGPAVPTVLFNAMINPLQKYTIRGLIWYQGEANRFQPELYSQLFPAMIRDWRERWREEFPFYFVQLAPFGRNVPDNSAAIFREVQLNTMLEVPNTGMVVTIDIGERDNIHPAEKMLVGKRLAYWALAKTYGMKGIGYCGPVYREMTIQGDEAILTFDYAEDGFSTFGKVLENFAVAGEDKVFYPARALIKGKELVVSSDSVEKPVAVRYCWENFAVGNLYNTRGLPASSFRTDNW